MIPCYLKVSGFLSYQDTVELDFTGFDLACITGSNGAGKSSILDSITWVLFGQARRHDDAVINSHAKGADVTFDFYYENIFYRVHRSKLKDKPTQLELYIRDENSQWHPLTEHSLRETEEKITNILQLDYDTFTNASFFLQGKADQFAQQRPGDRKRILVNILGLEIWETYRERSFERRKQFEGNLTGLDNTMEDIASELCQEDERHQRRKQLEESLAQMTSVRQKQEKVIENIRQMSASLQEQHHLVETLAGQYQSIQNRIETIEEQIVAHRTDQSRYEGQIAAADEIETSYQNWLSARQELNKWDEIAANFHQHEATRSTPLLAIQAERSKLEQELLNLSIEQKKLMDEENQQIQIHADLQLFNKEEEKLQAQLATRQKVEESLHSLMERQTESAAENKRLKIEMDELIERINKLEGSEGTTCPLCGQSLNPDERSRLIENLRAEGTTKGDHWRANKTFLDQVNDQRQVLEKNRSDYLGVENELRNCQRQMDQLTNRLEQIQRANVVWQQNGLLRMVDIERMLKEDDYTHDHRKNLVEIDKALKEIGYDTAAHDAIRRIEQLGRTSEENYRLLATARAALDPLKKIITNLEKQLADGSLELEQHKQVFQQAEERYQQDIKILPNLEQAEAELFNTQEQENRLRMQLGGAIQQVEVLDILRKRQKEYASQRTNLTREISRLKVLERAFGRDGVPALLIEQVLPEIEYQANNILDRLTAGSMAIRFTTQKDYKDKNREDKKETLDVLISDSTGTREYEMFSGGEAFRINFSIRMALSRVLAQRAGARLQTLVIDEGFGSQDMEGRHRLVEAINLVRNDFAKILVITHLEDLKDAFPTRIEVEKTSHGSQLQVVA